MANTAHDNFATLRAARKLMSEHPEFHLTEATAYTAIRRAEDGDTATPGADIQRVSTLPVYPDSAVLDREAKALRAAEPTLTPRQALEQVARLHVPDAAAVNQQHFSEMQRKLGGDRGSIAARAKQILASEGGSGFAATRAALLQAARELTA